MLASTRSIGGSVHFFSPQRIRQLKARFRELNGASTGRVLVKDFTVLFKDVFGRAPAKDELPENAVNPGRENGTVSFDETLKCMSKVARTWQGFDPKEGPAAGSKVEDGVSAEVDGVEGDALDITEAFKALQDDEAGVSVSNLCLLMESAGLALSEDDIVRMLSDVGAKRNEDGSIPYASFVKLLLA